CTSRGSACAASPAGSTSAGRSRPSRGLSRGDQRGAPDPMPIIPAHPPRVGRVEVATGLRTVTEPPWSETSNPRLRLTPSVPVGSDADPDEGATKPASAEAAAPTSTESDPERVPRTRLPSRVLSQRSTDPLLVT